MFYYLRRYHNSDHNRQFAGQLLGMTLNFLLRLAKSHSHTTEDQTGAEDSCRDASVPLSSSVESSIGKIHTVVTIYRYIHYLYMYKL